jgi:ABC-type branched-subunit amino acid transport system permease subunit
VYFWAFGLGILAYAVARVALDAKPHPIHWLSGLIGGLVGIPIGWLWFRWRGDLF